MATRSIKLLALAGAALLAATPALAFEKGDWLVRAGGSNVDPDSNNHPVVEVGDGTSVTFNLSYFLTDGFSVELLAALPFSHDIYLAGGGGKVGETSHLPPTVSLQYHFNSGGTFRPYVGVGYNWTTFFSESTQGAIDDVQLDLKNSYGFGYELGLDFMLDENWLLNLDVRWIDIETEAFLDGVSIGDVAIDPTVYGVHLGYKF